MKSYAALAKLFRLFQTIYFSLLFLLFTYFLIYGSYLYYQSHNYKDLIYIIYSVLVLIYISVITSISNRIEMKIYKEDFRGMLELLIIHSVLLGIINPIAFINYYLIYYLNIVEDFNIFTKIEVVEKKYLVPKILIKVATYCFVYYAFLVYLDVYRMIYHVYFENTGSLDSYQLFFAFFLIVCFIFLKIADKHIDQCKYLQSAIACIAIAILANPFSLHGPMLIVAGIMIIYQGDRHDQIKTKLDDMKKKYFVK